MKHCIVYLAIRLSRRQNLKFNMLLCWFIGKVASRIPEIYTLPVGRDLVQYDTLAVNTIVKSKDGKIISCDIPLSDDLYIK